MTKAVLHKCLRTLGFDVFRVRRNDYPLDFTADEIDIIRKVRPWTLTSAERINALIHAVRYISRTEVPGSIVECGVWKGGSMAAAAQTLMRMRDSNRDLYLFDSFEGMPAPTAKDVDYSGRPAAQVLNEDKGTRCDDVTQFAVERLLTETGYPRNRMHFVKGRIEETVPSSAPSVIALLRLDTDWYESTMHELHHLFPRLSRGGVIIIDDYGHWKGCKSACDEYFEKIGAPLLFNRIDYTGRIAVKL